MNDKKINYISFINAANMLNISESTFRRRLKKLDRKNIKEFLSTEID